MRHCRLLAHILIEIAALGATLYFITVFARGQIDTAHRIGNAPSSEADAPSEVDAISSGMNYYKLGFSSNFGLPDRGGPMGKLYLDPNQEADFHSVYKHYPPGPNWLVGIAMVIFGPKNVPWYRSLPIGFSVAALLATYMLLRGVIGCLLAAVAIVLVLHFPMTTAMMHGLFYHPYALTLLLVQMSFVFNRLEQASRFSWKALTVIALMGFVQGWLSFDWIFGAILYPLCVVSCWRDSSKRRQMLKAVFYSVLGFGLAQFLHFCQVWTFYSSFWAAFDDLFGSVKYRILGEGAKLVPENATMTILNTYLFRLIPSESQAAQFSWLVPLVSMGIVLIVGALSILRPKDASATRWIAPALISMAMAFVVSLMWVLIMKNHALEQGHWLFLPRHFIIVLFSCVLASVAGILALFRMARDLIGRFASQFR